MPYFCLRSRHLGLKLLQLQVLQPALMLILLHPNRLIAVQERLTVQLALRRRNQSMLSDAQIKSYHDDGFNVVEELFSPAEVESLRAAESSPEIQTLLAESGIKHKTVHLLELTCRHPTFHALASDPRITSCLKSLLGPDVQLQHSKLATKSVTKGTGAFGWH